MTIYGECDKWLNERKGNGGAEEGEQKGGLEGGDQSKVRPTVDVRESGEVVTHQRVRQE